MDSIASQLSTSTGSGPQAPSLPGATAGSWRSSGPDPVGVARLDLQRRASGNLRRHIQRGLIRFTVLVLADLASFAIMRGLVRAVRDYEVLGRAAAQMGEDVLPRGILNGWQYAAALFLSLLILGCYGSGDRRRDARRLFAASALATALPLWMTIWIRGFDLVMLQFVLTTTLVWLGLVGERLVVDRLITIIRPPERHAARTLFVGQEENCRETMASRAFAGATDYRSIGYVDTRLQASPGALGQVGDLSRIMHEAAVEVVVVCGYLSETRFREVVDLTQAAGCQLLTQPPGGRLAGLEPKVVRRNGQPLIELMEITLKGWQLVLKRGLDLLLGTVSLVVAAPFMALTAILIKLDSPGPVLFRQERYGTAGRRFQVFKFRTMRQGASDAAHRDLVRRMLSGDDHTTATKRDGKPVFKLVEDERVTRVGRLLRRTSLDELPQLFNVLRGEMSLVGPRPPLGYELELYDHWQFDRLEVRPGITGLWQVSGRNLLSYSQMCELDVQYVRNWSLWLDLKILFKTIPVVLFNSGRAE